MDHVDSISFPPELLAQLAANGDTHQFATGDVLFQEGDASETLYVLVTGRLKVYSTKENGREVVYNTLDPGEVLGEMFLDGGTRSASVKAVAPSECLIVDGDQIRELMRAHPQFAECLVLQLISRLRLATRKIRGLALDGVYERVAALLEESAIEVATERSVPRHLTQLEIANQVGATRVMVNHILRDLIRGGFVLKDERHRMTIVKPLPKRW
ncbi:Crp/Fnr family transcriptional regulator [Thermomonas carbonis]|uniref:CRP-like protein Clp n=1 Tax=Thermomonas carbonis TaxID=1463158 RepID=A0A7G9SLQ3_9GAMM|nr:Crp/Fnr family transcriptional regulator [Thermomonas carbonis]QNN68778.1 Crp/Fnr family transcriptional regulator [Thermomonas carbonis]GHC08843.1 Crp/Fnr family transcriptional regulator [Thermomonas carbonis]